jgi:hypothetical protein
VGNTEHCWRYSKSISTPHGKHPFSLNVCSKIAQILLLSCIDGPFCSGHLNPFESFFLLWIWRVTITHPDVKTEMVFECLKGLL